VYRLTGEMLLVRPVGQDVLGGLAPTLALSDRQPGEATEAFSRHAEPEAWFRRALDIARRQQAKTLELRAAMSLGRLWQRQGKRAEALKLLAPIYGWFSVLASSADNCAVRASKASPAVWPSACFVPAMAW
jgi:hypothetical protein